MLKQWLIVLHVVIATLAVTTASYALANESFDGWRPKSQSAPKEVASVQEKEMLQFAPNESNQVAADKVTQEEPFDWMDDYYGPSDAALQGHSNKVSTNEVVMTASKAPPPSRSPACKGWCNCQERRICKQCGLHLPSVAMYPTDTKESAGGYLNLADANPQKVFEDIRVGLSQVNDQIQSTLGRF